MGCSYDRYRLGISYWGWGLYGFNVLLGRDVWGEFRFGILVEGVFCLLIFIWIEILCGERKGKEIIGKFLNKD